MGKRIVIALGGNALGKNLHEQMDAVHVTAKAIADLIQDGHEVVIAHGNGPQVGMIQNAFAAYHKQEAKSDIMPLSMCVAMSQGYIGYDLQNVIGEELDRRGAGIHVATVLTQVAVDPKDPAFQHPTKPIGAFMTEEEAKKLAAEKGIDVAEDAGRGWRQVVQLLLGGLDCAAVLVTEHTDQADVQFLDRVLQRGDNRAIDELPGGAHGEQVAQALIKNDFRRYARVRAGEHRGIRVLAIKQRLTGLLILPWMVGLALGKAPVALQHAAPRCVRGRFLFKV